MAASKKEVMEHFHVGKERHVDIRVLGVEMDGIIVNESSKRTDDQRSSKQKRSAKRRSQRLGAHGPTMERKRGPDSNPGNRGRYFSRANSPYSTPVHDDHLNQLFTALNKAILKLNGRTCSLVAAAAGQPTTDFYDETGGGPDALLEALKTQKNYSVETAAAGDFVNFFRTAGLAETSNVMTLLHELSSNKRGTCTMMLNWLTALTLDVSS